MKIIDRHFKILFVSTFPPVKCGIASFTQDLVTAINMESLQKNQLAVCALDKKGSEGKYAFPVTMVMDGHDVDSCIKTAGIINRDESIDLVFIQHEFGLFGGESGEYLLGFFAHLEKPFIICYHTVLPATSEKRLKVVQAIGRLAEKVIVMTKNSARLLQEEYRMPANKITIIPHGTHIGSTEKAEDLKRKYDLTNKLVLTTFGLLSPNKGIENGILAMKEISAKFPQAMYIVLGLTHPNLLKQEGEKYREYLQQIIDENNLQKNVRLVNEYAPTKKLMEYLGLTDLYLFTSRDPHQAVSGTFLYAMSAGCCIISNPFVLATEMLDEETGVIINAGNEKELAGTAIRLLQDKKLIERLGHNAFLKTRETTWNKVAEKHTRLFNEILVRPVFMPGNIAPLVN